MKNNKITQSQASKIHYSNQRANMNSPSQSQENLDNLQLKKRLSVEMPIIPEAVKKPYFKRKASNMQQSTYKGGGYAFGSKGNAEAAQKESRINSLVSKRMPMNNRADHKPQKEAKIFTKGFINAMVNGNASHNPVHQRFTLLNSNNAQVRLKQKFDYHQKYIKSSDKKKLQASCQLFKSPKKNIQRIQTEETREFHAAQYENRCSFSDLKADSALNRKLTLETSQQIIENRPIDCQAQQKMSCKSVRFNSVFEKEQLGPCSNKRASCNKSPQTRYSYVRKRTSSILKNKSQSKNQSFNGSSLKSVNSHKSFSISSSVNSIYNEYEDTKSGRKRQNQKKVFVEDSVNIKVKKKYESILKMLSLKQKYPYHQSIYGNIGKTPYLANSPDFQSQKEKSLNFSPKKFVKKFKDQIFPPVYSSLFCSSRLKNASQQKGREIQWVRIPEVFPNVKLSLFNNESQNSWHDYDSNKRVKLHMSSLQDTDKGGFQQKNASIFCEKDSYASQFLATSFNTIKNNQKLLKKMFDQNSESQSLNQYGIYIVKIFQENSWKYVIIDDYIPVVKKQIKSSDKDQVENKWTGKKNINQKLNNVEKKYEYIPAFINVKIEEEVHMDILENPQGPVQKSNLNSREKNQTPAAFTSQLQIWPFLLEKAYSSYYGSYQSMTYGNTLDMLQELTNTPYQQIDLSHKKDPDQYLQTIDRLTKQMQNGTVMGIAQLKDRHPMIPLFYKAEFCYSTVTEETLTYYDPSDEYRPTLIKFYDLGLICTKIYLFNQEKYQCLQKLPVAFTISRPKIFNCSDSISLVSSENATNTIKHKNINTRNRIQQQENCIGKHQKSSKVIYQRQLPFVWKFTLKAPANECSVTIRQRDSRFLFHRQQTEYMWVRAILIHKQSYQIDTQTSEYRWIDGEYSDNKCICFNFKNSLYDAQGGGQYFLFVWPEWSKQKQKLRNDIRVNIYCINEQSVGGLKSIMYDPSILEIGCTDLAQRKGRLHQINKYICSYYLLYQKAAIIIQNINNERLQGDVNIIRSISGLKCKVEIVPLNEQFYEPIHASIKNQHFLSKKAQLQLKDNVSKESEGLICLAYKKDKIDAKIKASASFTVMLQMKGGIDHNFFKVFAFGA